MTRHLLKLSDLNTEELMELLDLGARFKQLRGSSEAAKPLAEKSVGMIFTKSSTRTRVSFEVGIHELGGNCIFLDSSALQVGRGESLADTAKVLNRYLHAVVIRCHKHADLEDYAAVSSIPVINALTDQYHPCQLLADLLTIQEEVGRLAGVKVAYLGDGASNMARSWAIAAKLAGIELAIGAPQGYQLDDQLLANLHGPGDVIQTDDPHAAAKGADIVYTDVWVSMGFEEEAQERLQTLQPYQVNTQLMQQAKDTAKVMHCLPAYRNKEITSDVLDGPASIIWDQAENRIHAQKAVLANLLSG